MLGTVMRNMKDGALSVAFKNFLNEKFAQYGKVLDCVIDTEANRLTIEALLHGETEPITATVLRYEIEKNAEGTFVALKRFDSSREWLTLLLTKLFAGKRYALPPVVSRLL